MVVVPTRLRTATQLAKVQHLLLVVAVGQTSPIAATTSAAPTQVVKVQGHKVIGETLLFR